mmetsp:Transcript_21474/g.19047  ORF Transcript_21474/g.19047 Transcript_21474/m.19047 type:complete len:113 (+) Transcript_21474:318-656(+)
MVIDVLFNFVFSQELAILFKIDYKISPVNLKHFIDHYMKILPTIQDKHKFETETSRLYSPLKSSIMPEAFEKNISGINKREQVELLKEINTEIKECINSISNLSPLLSDFSS